MIIISSSDHSDSEDWATVSSIWWISSAFRGFWDSVQEHWLLPMIWGIFISSAIFFCSPGWIFGNRSSVIIQIPTFFGISPFSNLNTIPSHLFLWLNKTVPGLQQFMLVCEEPYLCPSSEFLLVIIEYRNFTFIALHIDSVHQQNFLSYFYINAGCQEKHCNTN